MAKVLVLYYSSYGHIEVMANAIAEGAASVGGCEVAVKRVPELVPDDVAAASGIKTDQAAPVATVEELVDYDAIIFGTPTRFGNMAAQMRNFLDQTGGFGSPARSLARLAVCLRRPAASMVDRKRRLHRSTPACCIMA